MVERTCKIEVDWLKKWIKFLDLQALDTMKIENSRKIEENERNVIKIFREKTSLHCRSLLWMDFSYSELFKLYRKSIASSRL